MAQWIKHLLCTHEDLSSDLQKVRHSGGTVATCRVETGGSQGTHEPAWLTVTNKRPCLKVEG